MPITMRIDGSLSQSGIPIVSSFPAEIPEGATEFVMGVTSELSPGSYTDTISDAIPSGKTLHILFARASCEPLRDKTSLIKNYMKVELLWRYIEDQQETFSLIGKSYLTIECQAEFPRSSVCFDGVEMIGDGTDTKLVIRREVFGDCSNQDTIVAVRGYYI